jgi:hypothetical protein
MLPVSKQYFILKFVVWVQTTEKFPQLAVDKNEEGKRHCGHKPRPAVTKTSFSNQ